MIKVLMEDLPCSIKGFTYVDSEDFYTIVLNARLNHEQQVETYLHEMEHINNSDLYSEQDTDTIEEKRHS